ncbi:MAG: ABC transporter permease [Dehalococcoidia bacterium]|nr:ABC transporter permease [Dehalococcoidia bacterium]
MPPSPPRPYPVRHVRGVEMGQETAAQKVQIGAGTVIRPSPGKGVARRAMAWSGRYPLLPGLILLVMTVCGVLAPWIAPHDPIRPNYAAIAQPPAWSADGTSQFLLGTDHLGRDMLTRLVYGARVSLMVVLISTTSGMLIGTILGLVAGYFGGNVDEIISRIVDIWLAIPFLLVAMIIVIVLGQSFPLMLLLLALLAWSPFVRNVRAEVLSLRERDYVASAKISGAASARILLKHMLPNVTNTIMVIATLRVGQLILAESILSFLGVGVPPPTPAWGSMVADGRNYLNTAWWISSLPGVAILLVVMAFNFTGDWVRDRTDPRLRQLG